MSVQSSLPPVEFREPVPLFEDGLGSVDGKKKDHDVSDSWSSSKLLGFRFLAIFFGLTFVPILDWHLWRDIAHTHWLNFLGLFRLATFVPHYLYAPKWGVASFKNVGLIVVVAAAGALVWSRLDRNREHYKTGYYWLRVLVRYRLAIALIAYGFLQIIPVQFPRPTLSDLQTNYGEFLQWKLFYLTNGVATAGYGHALGVLEVLSGILLLWEKTTTIGTGTALALLGNITLANFAYQLGNHVLATILAIAALFLLSHDLKRLIDLLILNRKAIADHSAPIVLSQRSIRIRLVAKTAVLLFAFLYASEVLYAYKVEHWPFPAEKGTLANAAGLYDVREFTVNGRTIPYSTTDPVRWQNVVFEEWNTVSIRSNRPLTIAVANPEADYNDDPRAYEVAGNGGRHFYSYEADPVRKTLVLRGRNDAHESISLHYDDQPDGSLLLTGTDESGNTLRVILQKLDKKYLLLVGRRKPLNLY